MRSYATLKPRPAQVGLRRRIAAYWLIKQKFNSFDLVMGGYLEACDGLYKLLELDFLKLGSSQHARRSNRPAKPTTISLL
jgi:hypothetical protein